MIWSGSACACKRAARFAALLTAATLASPPSCQRLSSTPRPQAMPMRTLRRPGSALISRSSLSAQ